MLLHLHIFIYIELKAHYKFLKINIFFTDFLFRLKLSDSEFIKFQSISDYEEKVNILDIIVTANCVRKSACLKMVCECIKTSMELFQSPKEELYVRAILYSHFFSASHDQSN